MELEAGYASGCRLFSVVKKRTHMTFYVKHWKLLILYYIIFLKTRVIS
jgi:hypothetical protein